MYQKSVRSITPEEIEFLEEKIKSYQKQKAFTWKRAIIVVVSFFAFPYAMTMLLVRYLGAYLNWIGGIGAVICIFAFFGSIGGWWRNFKEARMMIRNIRQALKRGVAEVERIAAEQIAELESPEEFGPQYLFQVEEDVIWNAMGLELFEAPQMPNTNFEIITFPDLNDPSMVRINYHGEEIQPQFYFSYNDQSKLWDTFPFHQAGHATGQLEALAEALPRKEI